MPAGKPSFGDARPSMSPSVSSRWNKDPSSASATPSTGSVLYQRACVSAPDISTRDTLLPAPVTTPAAPSSPAKKEKGPIFLEPLPRRPLPSQSPEVGGAEEARKERPAPRSPNSPISADELEEILLPGYMPPKYHFFDVFPFSLLVRWLTAHGQDVRGRKAARLRAKMGRGAGGGNVPLEISLYLVSLADFLLLRGDGELMEILLDD